MVKRVQPAKTLTGFLRQVIPERLRPLAKGFLCFTQGPVTMAELTLLNHVLRTRLDITDSAEKRKMLSGQPYDPLDPVLSDARTYVDYLLRMYNFTGKGERQLKSRILQSLFGKIGEGSGIRPPFYCDYGSNIFIGSNVHLNFGCVFLDCNEIRIGDGVLIGPGTHIYTVNHPLDPQERATGVETTLPVTINSDVWLGGNVTILPGVMVGQDSVIGAGAVVTKDVPPGVFAAGNPCKIIKTL